MIEAELNTYKFINADDRVDGPHLRREGVLVKASWDEAVASAVSELKSFSKNEIAFIGSAYASCEDNYVLSKLAISLGTKNLDFKRHVNPAFGDDILRKNDVTPNTLGAELVGVVPGKGGKDFEGIIKDINDGKIKALYVMEEDLVGSDADLENVLAKLDLLIVHATNLNKTAQLADIVFPASTYAEKNGTMVNFQGRVQRLRPAVETVDLDRAIDGMSMSRLDKFGTQFDRWAKGNKHDARSSWKILSVISSALGQKKKFNLAEDVFDEISKTIEAFKGLDYDVLGELGAKANVKTAEIEQV